MYSVSNIRQSSLIFNIFRIHWSSNFKNLHLCASFHLNTTFADFTSKILWNPSPLPITVESLLWLTLRAGLWTLLLPGAQLTAILSHCQRIIFPTWRHDRTAPHLNSTTASTLPYQTKPKVIFLWTKPSEHVPAFPGSPCPSCDLHALAQAYPELCHWLFSLRLEFPCLPN